MNESDYLRDSKRESLPHAGGVDYVGLLQQAFWETPAQEKYIRIRAWWSFNSAYRGNATEEFSMSPEQEANLLRLLQLLDTNDPYESIMKAEILRGLGRFEECLKQLRQPFEDTYLSAIDAIKKLASCKERGVGIVR